jgi:hypothetical protein
MVQLLRNARRKGPAGVLQTAWALSLFSKEPKRARDLYREFVASAPPRYFERVLGSGTRTRPDQPYPYEPA